MKRRRVRMMCLPAFTLVAVAVVVDTLVPGAARWLPFHAPLATHLVVFTLVGVLARLALPESRWAMPGALALAAGLGSMVETMQLFVPARTFSFADLFANLGGSVAGVVLAGLFLAVFEKMRLDERDHATAVERD